MALNKKQTWRDFYNPIRGLTMTRLVAMEDQAERGQFALGQGDDLAGPDGA